MGETIPPEPPTIETECGACCSELPASMPCTVSGPIIGTASGMIERIGEDQCRFGGSFDIGEEDTVDIELFFCSVAGHPMIEFLVYGDIGLDFFVVAPTLHCVSFSFTSDNDYTYTVTV